MVKRLNEAAPDHQKVEICRLIIRAERHRAKARGAPLPSAPERPANNPNVAQFEGEAFRWASRRRDAREQADRKPSEQAAIIQRFTDHYW
jgi:hypothetical protein